MGCWNATCNISNMPIFAGDKVALIPLVKPREKAVYNCCYPTDNFVPFAFPIFGEYDEYGGIENAYTSEENKKHLLSMEYFYTSYGDDEFKVFNEKDNFDSFVSDVLCCHENAFVKVDTSIVHHTGYAEINFMMVHYDLYRAMVKEIANRIPYDKEDTLEHLLYNKFSKIVHASREQVKSFENMKKTATDEKMKAMADYMKHSEVKKIIDDVFSRGISINTEKWRDLAELMLNHPSTIDDIVEQITELQLFTLALSYMRKGYLADSGCGSQSEETRIHVILADFIMTMVEKRTQEREKHDEEFVRDVIPGIAETAFFFD